MTPPQKFAQRRGAITQAAGVASSVGSSPVEKHIVSATPAKSPRKPSVSSAFLQPEHFLAELMVTKSDDARPELAFFATYRRRRRESPQETLSVAKLENDGGMVSLQPDLESFYEPANAVPTLELSYDGKPAPAPPHLRTKTSKPVVTKALVCKNSEAGDSPGESTLVLQKSGSSGGSFKGASAGLQHKMRMSSLRENPGMQEEVDDKPSSALRRMLHWGASMEFLKSLGKKKKKLPHGKTREEPRLQRIETEAVSREEESSSPRSSASSASTTYSEVSSKSQSYKHAGSKKDVNSEAVKSKLWMLRKETEDDGNYKALRQGAMFQDHGHTGDVSADDDSLGGLESKTSVTKLVIAKHKRNSTWDAGNQMAPGDHIFSSKQPRLPSRDAHVLLAPPKRLLAGETETKNGKSSSFIEQSQSLPLPIPVENRTPSPSPSPSLVPVTIEPQSSPTSAHLSKTLNAASFPGNGDTQSHQQAFHSSPRLAGASPTSLQSSLTDTLTPGTLTPGTRSQRLTSVGHHELPNLLSRSHSAIAKLGVKSRKGSIPSSIPTSIPGLRGSPASSEHLALGLVSVVQGLSMAAGVTWSSSLQQHELPKSQVTRALSFEQIVAGRGRSPPTDNTLMKFFFKCREIEGLNKFLAIQKRRFLDVSFADSEKCFHMIVSEAGAGLSSMVSTICTAWLLENTMASVTTRVWHPIPVMNMCQQDMWNHRDAAWLFHVCGIDANALLFRDEITSTNEAVISGRVKRAVVGQDVFVTKANEVASSCTIVSEKFRQEAAKLLQARYMMTLLLAGILTDTNNLSSASPRDKQQATILLVGAGSLGRNGFYNHLMNIRDENYVTTFLKEIYGESNALSGEKPARLAADVETKGFTLPTTEKLSEIPVSAAASKLDSEVSAQILPSEKPSTKASIKSETAESKTDEPLSRKPNSPNSRMLRTTGEKPARLAADVETKGFILPTTEKLSEIPVSVAASKLDSEVSAQILPSEKPSTKASIKSETAAESKTDEPLSRKQNPPNSKISLAFRRWRNRSSA